MFSAINLSFTVLFFINIILGIVLTALITAPVVEMVRQAGFLRPNFKGDPIPVGVGFIFLLASLLALTVDYLLLPGLLGSKVLLFSTGMAVVTFLGLVDDTLGSREESGLKGHFKALFKGRLTTGGLKALAGGLLALVLALASYTDNNIWQLAGASNIIIDTLLIALSINVINLLDLRPGRACKGFLFLAVAVVSLGWGDEGLLPLALLVGCVFIYLRWDLKARTMMGDTGSNALGLVIGLAAVWTFSFTAKLVYLTILILFHLLTERYSLTKIIASNKILDYLDKLGRH